MVIWPEPSGEEVATGNETVDSEVAGATEDGEFAASWESEGWPDDSAVGTGGVESGG